MLNKFQFFFKGLFYFGLHWVFFAVHGLSLPEASEGYFLVVLHRLSCSTLCGVFPDQGSNPCALCWQADFQPLDHQGSPEVSSSNKDSKKWHCCLATFCVWLLSLSSISACPSPLTCHTPGTETPVVPRIHQTLPRPCFMALCVRSFTFFCLTQCVTQGGLELQLILFVLVRDTPIKKDSV